MDEQKDNEQKIYNRLWQNIIDVLTEQQIKLGFMKESVSLFYPITSIRRFMGDKTELNPDWLEMFAMNFKKYVAGIAGNLEMEIDRNSDPARVSIICSPEISEYVHSHQDENGFLLKFIETIGKHDINIDDVLNVFYKYATDDEKVHVEKKTDEEFDYLIFFEDGEPNDYYYCITDEGCHMIYHRFSPEDYNDIYGNNGEDE